MFSVSIISYYSSHVQDILYKDFLLETKIIIGYIKENNSVIKYWGGAANPPENPDKA